MLKSRGKAASRHAWDQSRPFTPPRPRPTQPVPRAYDEADYENGVGGGMAAASGLAGGTAAAAPCPHASGAAGSGGGGGTAESAMLSAMPTAYAVSVSPDLEDDELVVDAAAFNDVHEPPRRRRQPQPQPQPQQIVPRERYARTPLQPAALTQPQLQQQPTASSGLLPPQQAFLDGVFASDEDVDALLAEMELSASAGGLLAHEMAEKLLLS